MHQEVFDGDDDDDEMIGQFSGTSDWWTVGTLLIIAVSLQPPPLPALTLKASLPVMH